MSELQSETITSKIYMPVGIKILFGIDILIIVLILYYQQDPQTYWAAALLLLLGIILLMPLVVKVSKNGISYSYTFLIKRNIPWSEIQYCKVIKLDVFGEFWGYGIRYSKKYGWGYVLDSDYAIQIVKTNGKKLLLGIANSDHQQIEKAIKEYCAHCSDELV